MTESQLLKIVRSYELRSTYYNLIDIISHYNIILSDTQNEESLNLSYIGNPNKEDPTLSQIVKEALTNELLSRINRIDIELKSIQIKEDSK